MIRFTKARPKPKTPPKPKGSKKVLLNKLKSFLTATEPKAIEFLVSFWNTQAEGLTYKELREAYLAGEITEQRYQQWTQDYSMFIQNKLSPLWQQAANAAAAEVAAKYPKFIYEPPVSAAMDFIKTHGAELVTNITQEQRKALNAVIAHISGYTAVTPDEAARMIRPVIGLTVPQAVANVRHRQAVEQAYLKAHPNCRPETAKKKADEAAARYAGKQHRYRAQNIARTELAFAYNAGSYGATKDAQAQGYIGDCVKIWLTAYDERVCHICERMDGEKRNIDEKFSNGKIIPPGHPSCRCAVAYEEIPGTNLTPNSTDSTIETGEPELPLEPELNIEEGTQKLKAAMAEDDYKAYTGHLNKHENPAIKKLYAKYADGVAEIQSGTSGYYMPSTNKLVFSYPLQPYINNSKNKYSTLAHEFGHYFDSRAQFSDLHYNEIDTLNMYIIIGSGDRKIIRQVPSSSDEFLTALRKDKETLKPILSSIQKDLLSTDASAGVQDAISGMFSGSYGKHVKWGHQEGYYNRFYNSIKSLGYQKELQKAYKALKFDVSSQAKVKSICRNYGTASEMWANIMSAETCGGLELEYVKKYLPNTYRIFLEIIRKVE